MLSFQCFRTSIDLFAVAFWQSFFASTLQQSIYQFLSAGDCKEDLVRGLAIFIFIFEGHFYDFEKVFSKHYVPIPREVCLLFKNDKIHNYVFLT